MADANDTDPIVVADDLAESSMTVAEAAIPADDEGVAILVDTPARERDGDRSLAEFGEPADD